MQLSDTQIIAFLQSGEESLEGQACRFLYRQYYGMVESMVLKNSGALESTKDIFQEGLIVLWNMCKSKDFSLRSKVKTLLYSICFNLLRNRLRNRGKMDELQPTYHTIPIENTFFEALLVKEKNTLLLELLEQLKEDCQKVLNLYYYQMLSMKKIQAAFGDKSDAVTKNRKSRCLQRLRDKVLSNEQYVANLR